MIYGKNVKIAVSTASGLEKVLKSELKRQGYGDVPAENGSLSFTGSFIDAVRCNVFLRTAERVYIVLAEFPAVTFDQLFDGVKNIPFESFMGKDAKITVNGKCVKSRLFAVSASQSIVKKAASERLCEKFGLNFLPESGEEYKIIFSVFKDLVTVKLDTSGAGLHKRGYRDMVGIAPLKETLAAGILLLSDYYYERPLVDPFCGSGTFLTEGALIAKNIAPNLNRKFAFSDWKGFDGRILKKVKEEAKDKEKRDVKPLIFGSDIDKKAVDLSLRHIKRAGVEDCVKLKTAPVKDLILPHGRGTVVCNPPYGERVIGKVAARECYADLGRAVLSGDFSAFVITSDAAFERFFGKKADRKRKLYNSEKECNLYYYYKNTEK